MTSSKPAVTFESWDQVEEAGMRRSKLSWQGMVDNLAQNKVVRDLHEGLPSTSTNKAVPLH